MPKYLFSWDETTTLNLVIDAETLQQAHYKFDNGEYDYEDVEDVNTRWSDGPYVEEM